MRGVRGLCAFLLLILMGRVGGFQPESGECTVTRCFALFRQPSTFTGAQNVCRARGGQLMTVRSSGSQHVVSKLLQNSTGRFWIGLTLPAGCAEPSAPLRNFQWVTGDQDGGFSHWLPSSDSTCDAPRCVTVSREDDFRWGQGPCMVPAAGFLCEHSIGKPCRPLRPSLGDTVTYSTPMGFGAEELVFVPPGSTAVGGPSGVTHICSSERWLRAPWNCEVLKGGCEHRCAVAPNSAPSCYCPPGHSVNPLNNVSCEESGVQGDDPCSALGCAHICYQHGEAFSCACQHGYRLADDGVSCVDLNDCRDARQCPGENSACVNTVGGFQCVCTDGYVSSDDQCVDRDECVEAPCEHECSNTPGSYTCSCYDGYRKHPEDPNRCALHCGEPECPAECDPNNRFQCYCPEGYVSEERGGQVYCLDIDECSFLYCDQGCTNSYGGYACSCSPGYALVGQYKCVKTDDEESDGGPEGSGGPADPVFPTSPAIALPGPTERPAAVPAGGVVGIAVVTVLLVVLLLLFGLHHLLQRRGTTGGRHQLKAPETHGLHQVSTVS